ncbi:Y-family DNA polymerase [Flavobacterium caeni]|uniref:Protein ImuB n=1 Tax=Flavobacterium caeni TaxID=490189 RepID=A0A1G5B1D7_9FLAO|nr:DNA polymerase Y family protein [Flavobacterium caeni]SCX83983.1 protein ImuB [Flavobacterium caeni]
MSRYVYLFFPHLLAEYATRKNPELREVPLVLASPDRGRMVVDSVNVRAFQKGIRAGMVLADCKALYPELHMVETEPGRAGKLLHALAEWCVGYTPFVAVDQDGLVLDASGCTHLWGGERGYLENIRNRLEAYGYTVRMAMADTIGTAWAAAHFGKPFHIVPPEGQREALRQLPAAALRLEPDVLARLRKLGLRHIVSFMDMPRQALRRRFGPSLSFRLDQALGQEVEWVVPIAPVEPYQERLCCAEPITTATGIAIALNRLLEALCLRLSQEAMGLRHAVFKTFRIDGNIQQIEIGTGQPSCDPAHLLRLFEHRIATLEPDLGFELFVLEASRVAPIAHEQSTIWAVSSQSDKKVAELLDRVTAKTGAGKVSRYLPVEHHWPERSIKEAAPLWEKPATAWRTNQPRPVALLPSPESIEVTAVLPDNPPMLFRHKGKLHTVAKSDGPERIEQEWWRADGNYRDYYCVEDEEGARYWVFRSGPYVKGQLQWFLHGFFA